MNRCVLSENEHKKRVLPTAIKSHPFNDNLKFSLGVPATFIGLIFSPPIRNSAQTTGSTIF